MTEVFILLQVFESQTADGELDMLAPPHLYRTEQFATQLPEQEEKRFQRNFTFLSA